MSQELIHEVEEDLKREKLEKLWKEYGNYVIGAILALVLGTAITVFWRNSQVESRIEESEMYTNAINLTRQDKIDEALIILQDISDRRGTYATLADLQRVGILFNLKQGASAHQEAIQILKNMSQSSYGVDKTFQELAIVLYAYSQLDEENTTAISEMLRKAMVGSHTFEGLINEILTVIALENNDTEKAKVILEELINHKALPAGIKQRARILMSRI